jgi:hypothetical protein
MLADSGQHFQAKCLRILLGIKWQQKIPDTEVLERANLPSIYTLLQRTQYPGQATYIGFLITEYPSNSSMGN